MNVAPEIKPVMIDEFERLYVRPKPGRTLVIGSKVYKTRQDRRKLFANAIGVDMLAGEGVDIVCDLERPLTIKVHHALIGATHIDCVSVLEHCKQPWVVAEKLESLLSPGGTLFVTVPFIWRRHSYPNDYWRFTPDGVRLMFPRITWQQVKLSHGWIASEDEKKIPQVIHESQLYFARTEVYAFGVLP